jgi:hypothetical protein
MNSTINFCHWCKTIVYTPERFSLCSTCIAQRDLESQQHNDYISNQMVATEQAKVAGKCYDTMMANIDTFKSLDFTQMNETDLKATLLEFKQKLDIFCLCE